MNKFVKKKIYVVDVCDTLVWGDTTLGFIRYYLKHAGYLFRYYLFMIISHRFSPIFLLFVLIEKLTKRHQLKHVALKFLAGSTVKEINQYANRYAEFLLASKCIPAVTCVLKQREAGADLILASAGLEPVIAALANRLGASYIASTLMHCSNKLTGHYSYDLTGRKLNQLRQKFGPSFTENHVVVLSDNLSDLALLELAATAYVIVHKSEHIPKWDGLSATILKVYE